MSLLNKLGCVLTIGAIVLGTSTSHGQTKEKKVATAKDHRTAQGTQGRTNFVHFGGSALPEPSDRLGEFPSTATPMQIIGKIPSAHGKSF
jgi:hypothetical protein